MKEYKLIKKEYPDNIISIRWSGINLSDIESFTGFKTKAICDRGCCARIDTSPPIEIHDGDFICKDINNNIFVLKYESFIKIYEQA